MPVAPDDEAPAVATSRLREPEKLALPAPLVDLLVRLALRSEGGNLLWQGFIGAHRYPSWIVDGRWQLNIRDDADVVRAPPQE